MNMMNNIALNPELSPLYDRKVQVPLIDTLELLGIEFDGNNPEEPQAWVEIEDLVAEDTSYVELTGDVDPVAKIDKITAKDIVPLEIQELSKLFTWADTPRGQMDVYFEAIDAIRNMLRKVDTREELYDLVTLASNLDAVMNSLREWRKGWDAFAKLEIAFSNAEKNVIRLEKIAAEQARISEHARLHWLERSKLDNQRVSA